jgi:hypothetical protein
MQKLFINKIHKNKKVIQDIEFLNENYKNKFIHMSYTPLNISELYNLNKQNTPLYSIIDSNPIYDNPYGFWISCGTSWIKWIYYTSYYEPLVLEDKFIYEIIIDENNVLKINNLKELLKFQKKYGIYSEKKGYTIDWKVVKKDYDGLIICPYLGDKIWNNMDSPALFDLPPEANKYIKNALGKNIIKYPKLYLEWYRHWETSTGVIWRKRAIKKLNLIKL